MIEISEILFRWVKGLKFKQIASSLGFSKNTVKRIVRQAEELGLSIEDTADKVEEISSAMSVERYKQKAPIDSSATILKEFDERIQNWLKEDSMTVKQISRLIQKNGVELSYSSVVRYVNANFLNQKTYCIPITTLPGEEAQVDYGYVGLMLDPISNKMKKAQAFIMTLSYSRYRYVEFVFKQDAATWVQCHINAFNFFGGVPKAVVLDNLKAGVVAADIYDPTINKNYAGLERFYNFIADPAKVRTPEHKGRVERTVLIVKQQLIAGMIYKDINEANTYAKDWCKNINAHQVTRTTGESPAAMFEREREFLLKLPSKVFDIAEWAEAKVHKDHHVVFRNNFYSLPTKYIGTEVWVKGGLRTIEIYQDNQLIKIHVRLEGKGKWQSDVNDYPESALRFLQNTPEKCLIDATAIGKATLEVINLILEHKSKQRLRKAQAILRLSAIFNAERLEKACLRACSYSNYSYESIKNILEKKLEEKALEEETPLIKSNSVNGDYLRPSSEYITESGGVYHG
jgi:transposase